MTSSIGVMKTEAGQERMYKYYEDYAKLAVDYKVNVGLETATWRASPGWGDQVIKAIN